jgi:hypothetical protein
MIETKAGYIEVGRSPTENKHEPKASAISEFRMERTRAIHDSELRIDEGVKSK